MVYSLSELVSDCARARSTVYSPVALSETMLALGRWLFYCITSNRGANIPGFARFSWTAQTDGASQITNWQPQPIFLASERFVHDFRLHYRKPVDTPIARCEDLNFVKLAMRFSKLLTKEDAARSTKRLLCKLGEAMGRHPEVCIDLGIGKICSKDTNLVFIWDPQFAPDTESILSSPNRLSSSGYRHRISREGGSNEHKYRLPAVVEHQPQDTQRQQQQQAQQQQQQRPSTRSSMMSGPRLQTALSAASNVRMLVHNAGKGHTSLTEINVLPISPRLDREWEEMRTKSALQEIAPNSQPGRVSTADRTKTRSTQQLRPHPLGGLSITMTNEDKDAFVEEEVRRTKAHIEQQLIQHQKKEQQKIQADIQRQVQRQQTPLRHQQPNPRPSTSSASNNIRAQILDLNDVGDLSPAQADRIRRWIHDAPSTFSEIRFSAPPSSHGEINVINKARKNGRAPPSRASFDSIDIGRCPSTLSAALLAAMVQRDRRY